MIEFRSIERVDSVSFLASVLKSQHRMPKITGHLGAPAACAHNSTIFLQTSHPQHFQSRRSSGLQCPVLRATDMSASLVLPQLGKAFFMRYALFTDESVERVITGLTPVPAASGDVKRPRLRRLFGQALLFLNPPLFHVRCVVLSTSVPCEDRQSTANP